MISVKKNAIELYKQVFHPDLPNVALVGMCATVGAHSPVAEIQSRWVARIYAGHLPLPTSAEMARAIAKNHVLPAHQSPILMSVQLIEYGDKIASPLSVCPALWHHPRALLRWFFGPFTAQYYQLDRPAKL